MARLTPLLALVLLSPFLAGCFAEEADPTVEAAGVATSAEGAGAVAGSAPVAASAPYQVQSDPGAGDASTVTVYPLPVSTNPAKAPYIEEFSGAFEPYQCAPTGGGLPLGGLGFASGGQGYDVSQAFAKGDVYSYDVSLTFTNTDSSWGELHLWHFFDGVQNYWNEPTSEGRGEIVLNFTGQGFIVHEEFFAMVGVDCWYGQATSPIPYTIRIAITFAEGAIPSQAPVLVTVPAEATTLFVTGLSTAGEMAPVTSHFRVFNPDDTLLCECALLSNEDVAEVELPAAGEYVVLVDHTEGGFVSFGLDAPSDTPVRFLSMRFEQFVLSESEGGSVDQTVELVLPSTPLSMWAWVFAPGDWSEPPNAGAGNNVKISVANARGDVLRIGLVGYFTYRAAVPGLFGTNDWFAIPLDGDWEFYTDHHAYDLGTHLVTVKAEQMRGEARLFAQFYDRTATV